MANSILSLDDLRALAKDRKQLKLADALKKAGPAQTALAEIHKRDAMAGLRELVPDLPDAVSDEIAAMKPAAAAQSTPLEIARLAIKNAKLGQKERSAFDAAVSRFDLADVLEGAAAPGPPGEPVSRRKGRMGEDAHLASSLPAARSPLVERGGRVGPAALAGAATRRRRDALPRRRHALADEPEAGARAPRRR